jgi:hypothetical protein
MIRKRAPGGGRKPKGAVPMRSQVNVRMPEDMRAQLEAAARKRGRNVSEELLARLHASFAREDEQRREPVVRALNSAIFRLARNIRQFTLADVRNEEWVRNPFAFRAFKLGVAKLLDNFEPPGDVHPPVSEKGRPLWETPEELAERAVHMLLISIRYAEPLPKDWKLWFDDSDVVLRENSELLRIKEHLLPTQKKGD